MSNIIRPSDVPVQLYAALPDVRHSSLSMGVTMQLHDALPGLDFARYTIGNLDAGWAAFPDFTGCWEPLALDRRDENVVTNPWILAEVTSDATERVDRGIKLSRYRSLPSVEVIVLVAHRRRHVQVHRRVLGGWKVTEGGAGSLELPGMNLDVDALYRRGERFAE